MAFFPSAVPTTANLLVALNNTKVLLDVNAGVGDTTITVDDASPLQSSGYLTFNDDDDNPETISYTGKSGNDLTGVTRGDDSTAAAAHSADGTVALEARWNAKYHNLLADEVIAVATNVKNRFGLNTDIVVPTGIAFQITDGLGIGGAVDSKAMFSITSTTKGFLPPKMTTTQRDAIASPTEGLEIYNTTTHRKNIYQASNWRQVNLGGETDIVNADVSASAAIVYSKLSLTTSIVNGDINASAAIAVTKLAALTASRIVLTDGSGFLTAEAQATLTIAHGGTNSGTSLNNNRVMQSSGGAIVEAAAITASRALVSDSNGIPTHSAVTSTELGYVAGVTSSIQTQLSAIALTDLTAYTATITGCGTVTNKAFFYKVIGDLVFVTGGYTCGTVTANQVTVSLPNSYTINYAKLNTDAFANLGAGFRTPNSGTAAYAVADHLQLFSYADSSSMFIGNTYASGAPAKTLGNAMFANSDWIAVWFWFPKN
jgi:hypothetical protein